jgi:glycosyltransferase involved in cell wall biosynthesis
MDLLEEKGFRSILMKNGFDSKGLAGIEVEDSQFNLLVQNRITVVCVGTLLPIKGIFELLDAADILIREKQVNVHLIFIGKGNKDNYQSYAAKKGILENVHFVGHKRNPIGYVKKCTISACLSGGSGMSMVAIESMASGVPIVAWASPVYTQFNKNQDLMLLVEEKNPVALADGIMEIVNNYDFYLERGRKARAEAENYDWSVVCKRIEEIMKKDD